MTQWLAQSYTGLMLCKPCWNSQHNHRVEVFKPCKKHWGDPDTCKKECSNGKFVKTSQVIIDCEQIGCQCPCVALLNEKHPRVKPDHSNQIPMFSARRTERVHRDEG